MKYATLLLASVLAFIPSQVLADSVDDHLKVIAMHGLRRSKTGASPSQRLHADQRSWIDGFPSLPHVDYDVVDEWVLSLDNGQAGHVETKPTRWLTVRRLADAPEAVWRLEVSLGQPKFRTVVQIPTSGSIVLALPDQTDRDLLLVLRRERVTER